MIREDIIQNIMKSENIDREAAEKCAEILYGIQQEVDEFVSKNTFDFTTQQDRVNEIVKLSQVERITVTIDLPKEE